MPLSPEDQRRHDRLAEFLEPIREELLDHPGVTAVDVGRKFVAGEATDEWAIRFYVAEKKKHVARDERLPSRIEGVPTDVIEFEFTTYFDNRAYDPILGGISVSPTQLVDGDYAVGTLGLIVQNLDDGGPTVLSAFHVLCAAENWRVGDPISQPAPDQAGSRPVATITRAVFETLVGEAAIADVDAGTLASMDEVTGAIGRLNPVPGEATGAQDPHIGDRVRKRGAATGETEGTVDSVTFTFRHDYGPGKGTKTLVNQILVLSDLFGTRFADGGDSGSVVVNSATEAVGMVIGGVGRQFGRTRVVASDMKKVLSALLCRIQ